MLIRATNLKNKETNNIYNKKSFCTYHAPDWKERVTKWKQEKEKAVGPGDWDGTPNRAFGRDMEAGHATPQFLTSVRASPVPASQSAPAETTFATTLNCLNPRSCLGSLTSWLQSQSRSSILRWMSSYHPWPETRVPTTASAC